MLGQLANECAIVAESTVPTALVWGTEDAFLDSEYPRHVRLGASLSHGHYPFAGAGHSPHLEHPDRFNALLGDLIASAFTARATAAA
jgi:pimeloyl-ACP methyl ester carboxylesterase